ncbi:unnamed protein product [Brachionus calyciflorus]|uniref:Uncharacterized protein n=1 Tax=Brachionus calyciflorus TaxID=104777 RepID=A0A813YJ79_9BILA|nr:unnamed protein product [Brachionus calyciflorus]
MKFLKTLIILHLALSTWAYDFYHKSKCPDLKPMDNFNIEKLVGKWHLKMMSYVTDDQLVSETCYENKHSIINKDTLKMEIISDQSNGSVFNEIRKIDNARPGVFIGEEEATLYGFFGNSYQKKIPDVLTVLHIDDELLFGYVCRQLDHFWYSEAEYYFYISIRNRNFDSFSKLIPIFQKLKSIPEDLNRIQVLKNDLTCNK